MKLYPKLVALMLLLGLLALPMAALSQCWMNDGSSSHHGCHSGCPMMAMMPKAHQAPAESIEAQPQNLNCCQISSGRTEPVSPLLVSPYTTSLRPLTVQTVALSLPTFVMSSRSAESAPPPTAPSQPVLCTFLI